MFFCRTSSKRYDPFRFERALGSSSCFPYKCGIYRIVLKCGYSLGRSDRIRNLRGCLIVSAGFAETRVVCKRSERLFSVIFLTGFFKLLSTRSAANGEIGFV